MNDSLVKTIYGHYTQFRVIRRAHIWSHLAVGISTNRLLYPDAKVKSLLLSLPTCFTMSGPTRFRYILQPEPKVIPRMHLLRVRQITRFIFFSILFAIAGSLCLAQETDRAQRPEKPVAPEPKPPLVPAKQSLWLVYAQEPYTTISGKDRVKRAALVTIGPQSLLVGTLLAGIDTAQNTPHEYGPHWDGFAKRYGMRFSGVAASAAMEAGLGAMWGEDPRYVSDPSLAFKGRLRNIFVMTVAARDRDANLRPAYARFIAIGGSNFLSNTWRADSEANTSDALTRIGYGFLAKIAGNAWLEFGPDVKRVVLRRH